MTALPPEVEAKIADIGDDCDKQTDSPYDREHGAREMAEWMIEEVHEACGKPFKNSLPMDGESCCWNRLTLYRITRAEWLRRQEWR